MIEITPEYLAQQGLSPTFPQRFWEKVDRTETCWLWTAALSNNWCGEIMARIGPDRRVIMIRAPRASWILHRGPIPEGMVVCHNCPERDNPRCVNPDHLFLDTIAGNVADQIAKSKLRGTWKTICLSKGKRGESHDSAKLTARQVEQIRHLYDPKKRNGAELARAFRIGTSQLWRIVHGLSWY